MVSVACDLSAACARGRHTNRAATAGARHLTKAGNRSMSVRPTANNGNQFSIVPPDQGLCVGNGFVFETVNDVLQVFDTRGRALSPPADLNSFYGYPPIIDRVNGIFGPEPTDPSSLFDAATNRWFHVVLTLEVDPEDGALTGANHLDLAVSKTGNPLDSFNIYQLPVQDEGTRAPRATSATRASATTRTSAPTSTAST